MVDEEVENILAEIRERVRARELPSATTANSTPDLGTGESSFAVPGNLAASEAEALARIDSYLTVTSRAWDRLPPLISNRNGSMARIELWVKRQIKRATHWFTWEQVNFNAAVHHALRDALQALSAYERAWEEWHAKTESHRTMLAESQAAFNLQREKFETERAELQAQRSAQIVTQRKEMDARLAAFAQELQERFAHQQEEQRVCFKQLSLEATETAVLEDRARRKTEQLLQDLRIRLDQLEKR